MVELNLTERPKILFYKDGLFKGPSVMHYQMKDIYTMHYYFYNGVLICNNNEYKIKPHSLSITPPMANLTYHFNEPSCFHHCYHFKLSKTRSQDIYEMPAINYLNPKNNILDSFKKSVAKCATEPLLSEVTLWHILYECSNKKMYKLALSAHPLVTKALQYIDSSIGEEISVTHIAKQVNLTPTHLTRLFKEELGTGVASTLRHKRVELAKYMLKYTTLPIKNIAHQVGIPDTQYFNKTIRAIAGVSPKKLRNSTDHLGK